MIDLWLTRIDDWQDQHDELAAVLSEAERARAARLVDPGARRRFATGRSLLRRALARRLAVDAAAVVIEMLPGGKPGLRRPPGAPDLRFSASSSGEWLAIAMATGVEIGVDIEGHRRIGADLLLAPAILTAAERDALVKMADEPRSVTFLRWWTRKEAVMKADGRGAAAGFDRIEAGPAAFTAAPHVLKLDGRDFLLGDFSVEPPLHCAVAAIAARDRGPSLPFVKAVDYSEAVSHP